MENERPYLVLGLDPGIGSCGFALLDMTNHKILELGSHLFDVPQESKTKVSLAVTRRNARSVRRNTLRTKNRLKHCLELLKAQGLVPEDADKVWLQQQKGDKPVLKLRAKGLDEELTPREFAQVLYSLCAHRGYIPHGEGRGETDDAESGKVLKAIKENSEAFANGEYRTIGEMLARDGRSRNHGGDYAYCVYNKQIQDEVHKLFEAQRSVENPVATEAFEQAYISCLIWEKKSIDYDEKVYGTVGHCVYFPEERRAASADVSSELCRAYERFGHLVIVNEDGSEQTLSTERINGYLRVLFSEAPLKRNKDCKVTYANIRQDLDLPARSTFKGVDADKEKTAEPFAPKSWRCLRKSGLSPELLRRMLSDRVLGDAVCEALTFASTEESLKNQLEGLDLSEIEKLEIVSLVPFTGKLFKGYGTRSLKALGILLGAFEEDEVRTLTQAEQATGLDGQRFSEKNVRQTILPAYEAYDPTCNNPVVLRAMGRMRRIVNSISKIYGVPDEIHIELGRELKQSKREKDLITKRNRENESRNKRFAQQAAEILGVEPEEVRGKVIRKLAMREEQQEIDLYTGESINLERLVREDHYCEIDHILPYSRTCDDSRANKVLVLSRSNQEKKERTPYEWMNSGEAGAPSWSEYKARILTFVKNSRKRAHFLNEDLGEKAQAEFISRNLNDDRYMSVAVKNYLEDCLLFPDGERKKHVSAVAGGATGNLRWVWGLNFGEGNTKDRSDDRHHAIDAAVIAACSDGVVKKVAQESSHGYKEFKRRRESRLADTQPWPTFADELIARREFVIPTRMVNHGVTGRVFEDTLYRLVGFTEDKGKYPLVRASKKTSKKGNVVVREDGSAKLVDGMAFVRLWLDPTANPTKAVKGKWYVEPVYFADIPAIKAGTYVPRVCAIGVARVNWEPVPNEALVGGPIVLYRGDVLSVDGHLGRYWGLDISVCSLKFNDLKTGESLKGFPTLSKWGKDTEVKVIQEDCLGHCYSGLVLPN